jgi:nucleotide-binding universal stress UspA family protein
MKIRKILLATDFSPCARQAYAPAADLALRMEATLELVHCLEYRTQYTPAGMLEIKGTLEAFRKLQEENLQREAADPLFRGIPVGTHLLEGEGAESIRNLTVEKEVDLIAQSSHGFTGLKRFFLGSFAERLLRISPAPVLTFKSAEGPGALPLKGFRPRRILFPYDFSEAAKEALGPVKLLAEAYGARVLLLYVWRSLADLVPVYGTQGVAVDIELVSYTEDFPDLLLKDLRAFGAHALPGLEIEGQVMSGDPGSVILARAATYEADLICMATHGWTGLQRVFLGSVAEKVLRGAHCPTLTVRIPPEKLKD